MKLSPESEKQLSEYKTNFRSFAKDAIKIRDHNTGMIVPLVFNRGQEIQHRIAEKQKKEKGYIRQLLLKTRRFGGSTYIEGRFYQHTSLNFNRNTFITGHEEDSTSTLYSMAKLMQEQNPIAPSTRKSNSQELIFDTQDGTGLKSQYRLSTARNVDAGKSQGIHYLHLSEEAMYQGGGHDLLSGLLQCVPPVTAPIDTEVFRESTAKGYGNSFQVDVFKTYREGQYPYYEEDGITYAWYNPNSHWVLAFIPWFVHKWYSMPFETEEQKNKIISAVREKVFNKESMRWEHSEEYTLKKRFKLTLEQLNWRASCIENECRGSVETFHQEYPSTVEEAFLSSGLNVFSKELCDELEEQCYDPILIGDVVERAGKPKIRRNRHGHFKVWLKPEKHLEYIMVVDSAGGIKKSQIQSQREPDPACIDVYEHVSGKQVAQWHGHLDYDLIADLVELIGQLYNKAIAVVEVNNHGYTVVADLKKKHYPMYEAKMGEPGWLTNRKTKPQMVDALIRMSRDAQVQIMCKQTVSEMRTFVEESGRFEAAPGCHDERVDTAGIACMIMTLLPHRLFSSSRLDGIQNWHNKDKPEPYQQPQSYVVYAE
jgi:hypothetical protein